VGANRVQAKKTLAAQTAFAMSNRAYSEYKAKVIEQIGENKEQKVRDAIAEDTVKKTSPEIIIAGSGGVLCCELYTQRYFDSDMESLKRAVNELNSKLLKHDYATLEDFYHLIGVSGTSVSAQLGWKSDKLLELYFSTQMANNGQPCLAFDYNYLETF
jgi:Golgi nucleoside diphosphatase